MGSAYYVLAVNSQGSCWFYVNSERERLGFRG